MQEDLKKIKVLYDTIVITANKVSAEDLAKDGLDMPDEAKGKVLYADVQKVIACGKMAEDVGINVGDEVVMKVENFMRHTIKDNSLKNTAKDEFVTILPLTHIGDETVMFISTRDVKYFYKK